MMSTGMRVSIVFGGITSASPKETRPAFRIGTKIDLNSATCLAKAVPRSHQQLHLEHSTFSQSMNPIRRIVSQMSAPWWGHSSQF